MDGVGEQKEGGVPWTSRASRFLHRFAPVVSYAVFALVAASFVVLLLRCTGEQEPWTLISALSSLAVVVVAVLALGQWKAQMRARSRQSAATDVLERAYENQELFWEISRHVLQVLMNKTYKRQLV